MNFWAIVFCSLLLIDLVANCVVIFKKNKNKEEKENKGENENV